MTSPARVRTRVAGGLVADVSIARSEFDVTVDATVEPGQVVAVLGRNGSGKSTLLGVLGGLLRPDRGTVRLGERVLTDVANGTLVPPHRRRVALLAQEPLLFPHLSVVDNVAFGPRSAGLSRAAARRQARDHLGAVDATSLADRRPTQLSGGQAARVALARALAADPDLLLLDEPLAAVDVDAAPGLRALLRELLADRLAIVVTHDVLDAAVLADRVLVMESGRVVEDGPTRQVLTQPRSPFAAQVAGLNLVSGIATDAGVRTTDGVTFAGMSEQVRVGSSAIAVFPPTAVAVHTTEPHGSPRNAVRDRIVGLEVHGAVARVNGAGGITASVTPAAVADLGLHPGSEVWFVIKATEVAIHPR